MRRIKKTPKWWTDAYDKPQYCLNCNRVLFKSQEVLCADCKSEIKSIEDSLEA